MLEDPGIKKVGQNIKYDLIVCESMNLTCWPAQSPFQARRKSFWRSPSRNCWSRSAGGLVLPVLNFRSSIIATPTPP
ncbi:MAG: hypothetical protein VCG02_01400 [Verrucomicrobiota bacterium]